MSATTATLAQAFWQAARSEEQRARSLPILPAKDSNGDSISPGDTVRVQLGEAIHVGVVHAGRNISKNGPREYRDLEIELADGRRIPYRSHIVTRQRVEAPRGISETQWKIILRLRGNAKLSRTSEDSWNTEPPGEPVRPPTINSMAIRGWLEEATTGSYRLTPQASELGRLAKPDMMEAP